MPGFDRTGPMGAGPRTGGGFGYCGRNANTGAVRGIGAGGGFGRGRRNASFYGRGRRSRLRNRILYPEAYHQWSPDQERTYYMDHIADLKAELAAAENRLAELDGSPDDKTKD